MLLTVGYVPNKSSEVVSVSYVTNTYQEGVGMSSSNVHYLICFLTINSNSLYPRHSSNTMLSNVNFLFG